MDVNTLAERVRAARRHTIQTSALPGVEFVVMLPTRHQWRTDLMRHMTPGASVASASVESERHMLVLSMCGWTGLRLSHIDPGISPADDAELQFDRSEHTKLTELLFDERPDVAAQISDRITALMRERDERFEAAAKNSASASLGNEAVATRSDSSMPASTT